MSPARDVVERTEWDAREWERDRRPETFRGGQRWMIMDPMHRANDRRGRSEATQDHRPMRTSISAFTP